MVKSSAPEPARRGCPHCHKPVDAGAWAMHPRYCSARPADGDLTEASPTAWNYDDAALPTELGGSTAADPRPALATSRDAASRGSKEIVAYLAWGVILQVIGGLLFGIGLGNATSTNLIGVSQTSGGAIFAIVLGWMAALAGAFLVLVGVIAKGVQIGNRAS